MSVTYLAHKPCLSKAISSASLDALMQPTNSTDKEKFSSDNHNNSRITTLKRPAAYDEDKVTLSCLKFTPSQVLKIKKTIKDSSIRGCSPEVRISPSSKHTSSERRIKRVLPSLDTRYSTSSSDKTSPSPLETSSGSESLNTSDLSVYFTPESKPTTPNTSCDNSKPRAKRSIVDQFRDEDHSSPNSSFNYSPYYSPESSPGDSGSSVKRPRIRWSDSTNLISLSDSVNSDYLNESFSSLEPLDVIQPKLIGYQMIGDSQFCRFGQQLLGLQRVPTPNSSGRIGICVSGQTIPDLHRRVKEKFYPISEKIILMIGTNDFLRNTDVTTMCHELSELISTLLETVKNIVLLTLPPIPKLERKQSIQHFVQLDQYNQHIRSLEDGDTVRIADVSPMYMSSPPFRRCRMQYFEVYFGGPARRHDMIHLSRQGLEVIRKYILEHFL